MSKPRCSEPDCKRPVRAKGLCYPHYQQYRRNKARGKPDAPLHPVGGPGGRQGDEPRVRIPGPRVRVSTRDWIAEQGPVTEVAARLLEEAREQLVRLRERKGQPPATC